MPKILIADDEVLIRLLLEETLEEMAEQGSEVFRAENGVEALETALAEHPDLVFLDVMMPGMNGFEVCEAIKRDPEAKRAFVVILTAKGQDIDVENGRRAGADMYMTKPFDPDELLSLAENVLGG